MSLGSSRGIALLSVLWITGLLAVIAASFASGTRTEARLARNQIANAKAEALADGGVHRAVLGLLEPDPEQAWRADGTVHEMRLGEGLVQIAIEDEDGKIDLNAAPVPLLAGLFGVLGLSPDEARAMAERIVDYRDPDTDPEPQGAEDPDYFALGRGGGAADRELLSTGELLNVLGMTRELYERAEPYVTVYSGAEGVDPVRAKRAVLEALPGMTPQLVEQLLNAGSDFDPFLDLEDETLLEQLEIYFLPTRDAVFTIRALARTEDGGSFLRATVIELDGEPERPFMVLDWRRGRGLPETADEQPPSLL
jgi:general secretion pathway protein K